MTTHANYCRNLLELGAGLVVPTMDLRLHNNLMELSGAGLVHASLTVSLITRPDGSKLPDLTAAHVKAMYAIRDLLVDKL